MRLPGWRTHFSLVILALAAGCTSETRVRVEDFSRPLVLSHVSSPKAVIVGMVLEVSGKAVEPITVTVRCDDTVLTRFDVSNEFLRIAKVDAYTACVNLIFESKSFVNSSMTVSYSYTILS